MFALHLLRELRNFDKFHQLLTEKFTSIFEGAVCCLQPIHDAMEKVPVLVSTSNHNENIIQNCMCIEIKQLNTPQV